MKKLYYDVDKTMSYNKKVNIISGVRGSGKTFAFKLFALKQYVKNGTKTVWMRHNNNQLREFRDSFFNDLRNKQDSIPWLKEFFEEYNITSDKHKIYINNDVAIDFRAITIFTRSKSVSFDEKFNLIIYDEYITAVDGQILDTSTDVTSYLECINTIQRDRAGVKIILMSNAITKGDPYLLHYGIKIKDVGNKNRRGKEYITYKDNPTVLLHNDVYNVRFREHMLASENVEHIKDTKYGNYSLKGDHLLDDDINIRTFKHMDKDCLFSIDDCYIWQVYTKNKETPIKLFCSTSVTHKEGVLHISSKPQISKHPLRNFGELKEAIRAYVSMGIIYFESQIEKNIIFTMLG